MPWDRKEEHPAANLFGYLCVFAPCYQFSLKLIPQIGKGNLPFLDVGNFKIFQKLLCQGQLIHFYGSVCDDQFAPTPGRNGRWEFLKQTKCTRLLLVLNKTL